MIKKFCLCKCGEDEPLRKKHFAKYGFKTLVVWENELGNKSKLLSKLKRFEND
tara:strand:+ start:2259 stop:2417 length:159 start_codon:yes stop_codon:yes gene_type:complete